MDNNNDDTRQIVRKVYVPPTPASATTMTVEQSASWNAWATGLIAARTAELADVLGAECGQIEARLQKQIAELQKQITDLRIENAFERGKNAGVVVDLPALPPRKHLNVV
jgi:hypothetical protein